MPGARTYGGSYTAISDDGRYVGYGSGSRYASAYVYDRVTGRITQANGSELSSVDSLSADGRFAAVTVGSRNPSRPARLFVRDLTDGTDEQIDPLQTPTGRPTVSTGLLSGDGRLLAFATGRAAARTTSSSRTGPTEPCGRWTYRWTGCRTTGGAGWRG